MAEIAELEAAIAALEAQRGVLGDGVVDAAVGPMREKLAELVKAEATPQVPADDGERKFVTMIFADLSGSTALGEVMDPEEIRDLLNGCFDRLVPTVKRFGGTIDKFIGDNVMALFGAPVAHENDPERALRAGLAMMEALADFNADSGVELGIHVGINSGLVIAGGVGSEGERRYSVLGDAVNVAARLEGASERGEILVGPDTRRLAGPLFEYVDLDPISVKGRDEPVAVSRLVGVRAGRESGRGIKGLSSPMVGRDAELEQLVGLLEGVAEGRGGLVAVVSEAGVGKSRFVAEAMAGSSEFVSWAEGGALAHTTDTPHALVNDLIRDLLAVMPDASLEDVSGALAARLALSMTPEEAEAEWPFLARLLDLPLGETAESVIGQYGDAQEVLAKRTEGAFVRLVEASAAEPLVLVWEDLHWADRSSLTLLQALVRLTANTPLLLVLMFRPGDSPVSALHQRLTDDPTAGYEIIELSPLSSADSESLIDGLLNIDNLPEATRNLILDRAQGNPLFLEELLRALIDAGMVIIEPDKAVATDAIHDLEAIDIPDTVHGVIGARIDRLPPARKATLQSASVIGRSFQRRVLEHLNESEGLGDDLDELRRLDFITPEFDEYLFKHVFTQEAAYNGMLLARRRGLHATAAKTIETLFPDRLDELSATLARHHEKADQPEKAIPHLLAAAQRAATAYANHDSLALAERGLALIDSEDRRTQSEFLLLRERVLDVVGERDHQGADLDALATLAKSMSDDSLLLEVTLRRADLQVEFGEFEAALETARSALDLAELLDDAVGVSRAHLTVGGTLLRLSEIGEAEKQLRLGLAVAEEHDLAEQQMLLLQKIAAVAFGRKDHTESQARLEAALGLAQQLDDRHRQGVIRQNLGIMTIHLCDFDYCRKHINRAIEIAQETGWKALEAGAIASLGEANRLDGRLEDALDNSRLALTIAAQIESPFWIAVQHRSVADALIELGRADEAIAEATLAVEQWRELGSTPHLMDCIATLSSAKKDAGDLNGAMTTVEEAVRFLLDGGDVTGAAYPFRVHATCLDLLKATDDPRFDQLLTQANHLLDTLYPQGGCLPWHQEIRQLAAEATPRP